MLGNFSFGDYFKKEACQFAHMLLTRVYELPPERLFYTVHHEDQEAYDIWVNEVGIPPERVCKLGDKDNFWMMADTGPCGYTSEIHWDNEPEEGVESAQASFDADDGRFLEIWNLVFMQFEAQPDGSRVPLPQTGVDTGLGFERLVSIIQEKDNNYDTDVFMPIIRATQELTGHTDEELRENIVPYRVIADHLRAACVMIADGVRPGTQGRDYVCRMVLRRAMRFGKKLPFDTPTFLAPLTGVVINILGEAYPELLEQRDSISRVIDTEERRFLRTMDRGLNELDNMLNELTLGGQLSGKDAFYLHATLGLPFEVTRDVAEEHGFGVDEASFRAEQEEHIKVSRQGSAFGDIDVGEAYNRLLVQLKQNGFSGVKHQIYEGLTSEATVLALLLNGQPIDEATVGERVEVVLDATPFYVESGGQVSDTGVIEGEGWLVDVEDVRRPVGSLIVHIGEVVEGRVTNNVKAMARVDGERRVGIMRNHTATHLLHAALRNRLGTHVQQRGSLVAPDRLRFDFSHDQAMTFDEINDVQRDVNFEILEDLPVVPQWKDLETAKSEGAMALFGEKYGENVRTISIGEGENRYSYELCGGTHMPRTAPIGPFVIVQETAVAQGIRRIEAITGQQALMYNTHTNTVVNQMAERLQTGRAVLPDRVEGLQTDLKNTQHEVERLRTRLAHYEFKELMSRTQQILGVNVLVTRVSTTTADTLRQMADWFRDVYPEDGVLVIGMVAETGKPQLLVAVTEDLTKRVHAGNLIREVAKIVEGGGGGRPNLAQAGGKDPNKLDAALSHAQKLIEEALD
jgi:alanyl-tRNA synthetase